MQEYTRTFDYPNLQLQGTLDVFCPVQAYSTIANYSFYFRARYEQWSFAISEHPHIDPVDIQLPRMAAQYGFLREGVVGKEGEYAASYMELDEAEKLIVACTEEYLSTKIKN